MSEYRIEELKDRWVMGEKIPDTYQIISPEGSFVIANSSKEVVLDLAFNLNEVRSRRLIFNGTIDASNWLTSFLKDS